MSTQNARDTHFFLAGWNGHIENANATTHFQQAMKSAPAPTEPLPAEHTTRSDAETMARAETTARFLLGWKYGQMPASPDTLLRQSARVKAKWAWNAACKLLRFIDGSAPAEVQAAATEPMGPEATAAQAIEQAAVAVPAMQWRAIKDGMPAWTDDNSIRVIAITAEDDFSGAQVHDVAAADFHIRDPEGPTDPDSVGTEVTRACTHWAYRDEICPPRAALAAPPPAPTPTYLPLLVRDIARDLGITSPEACATLKPLGNFSVNSAVTAEMVAKLREQHPATQAQDVQRDALDDTALLDAMTANRIAVAPEFQGPWDAELYGEEGEPVACGSGNTPREAIRAAIAASAAQEAGSHG
ncbi:hypothetical protein KW830_08380 [Comamonas sp. CMM03]|uniref:hypothetical protein n=1 Tax=Comamonas sp. CMM03 TaxID=2854781 RepID=UPI001C44F88B|nr:hypothetical protein [Comamonas sp. CMM03]MBV7418472.1 hypothetical protein [Comamonas sp. CMM03]